MKKLLSIILSALMLTSVFAGVGITANAAEFTSGDYVFTVSNYRATITDYIGEDTVIEVPSKLNGYTVIEIGDNAFKSCWKITDVTIPSTITTIGSWAFYNCQSLKNIVIPNSVTTIESYAFQSCSSLEKIALPESITSIWTGAFWYCSALTEVNLPSGIKYIGSQMFQYCISLKSITIPDGVTAIRQYAFADTGITSIHIPASVTEIAQQAFEDSESMTSIDVDSENENYCSVDGVLFNKDKTILMAYPIGREAQSYTIPDGVVELDESSFYRCNNLKTVYFSDTVTTISPQAFRYSTGITSMTFPDSLTKIGARAFGSCFYLEEVKFGKGLQEIGGEAFCYCTNLKSLNLPASLSVIGQGAFLWCYDLAEITVDENNEIFCAVDNVLFNKDKTTLIRYPEGNTRTSYAMPDTVTTVGRSSFHNSGDLTEIKMSENIQSLEPYSFAYCSNLKEAALPESVNTVGENAFSNCTKLEKIYFLNPDCEIYDVYATLPNATVIYGYTGSTAETFATTYNRTFVPFDFSYTVLADGTAEITGYSGSETNIVIPATYCGYKFTAIADSIFSNPATVTGVTIPEYVTTIGAGVFANCTALETVNYNAINCTTFGDGSTSPFVNCTALKTVNFGDMVEYIPAYAFQNCTSIENVAFGKSIVNIGLNSFYGCTGISGEVVIPDSVKKLDPYCFYGCTGITKVKMGNSVETISGGSFDNCRNMKEINIPDTVAIIGNRAFYRCIRLTSIIIPENVTTIGRSAFSLCQGMESIYFFSNNCKINDDEYTFIDCNAVFYGYTGSTAETHASTYGKTFKELVMGDTGGDGVLTISDATEIQKNIARITSFNQGQNILGDVNGDGKLSIRDVTYIQMMVANIIDTFPV